MKMLKSIINMLNMLQKVEKDMKVLRSIDFFKAQMKLLEMKNTQGGIKADWTVNTKMQQ